MTASQPKDLAGWAEEIEQRLMKAPLFFGHSTTSASDEAAWIALFSTGQDIDSDEFDWELIPDEASVKQMTELTDKRISSQKPLAYLVNEAWFCGLRFYVDERVIVPRSYFGEWIPDQFHPWLPADPVTRALDLCTGSGCIAVALAYAFPEAEVCATELSADAVAVARKNVAFHQLENRLTVHCGDLFADVEGRFDLICSNPPYISNVRMETLPAEYLHEPDMAFRGGDNGLDLVDVLLAKALDYLTENGTLIVEVGTAALDLEARYPTLPFTWLTVEDDAMALFLVTANDLRNAGFKATV